MGVKYSATDSALLIQALTNNITTANQVSDRLASGCDHLMSALDSGELQGAASTAGRGLFSDIIIPSINKMQEAIDDIHGELTSYIAADGVVSEFGLLDLDQLEILKVVKQKQLENVERQIQENKSFLSNVIATLTFSVEKLWEDTFALYETQNQLEKDISEIDDKIDKLKCFVSQVSR
ncbi:MAG: hypothetical protein Q4A74_09930 [Cardiobacteriaceae bacterium]|nr:hypothetical protein [Cardiobacteriaceae bacterium]